MYVPTHFAVADPAASHRLIAENAFGELVTVDETGAPFASHLPFLLDAGRGPQGTLVAHMARANPQWRHFAAGKPVLAIFHGPHAYVSPAWYATHPAVPTWNYVAVHAYGVPRIVEDASAVKDILGRLVDANEAANGTAWRMGGLSEPYLAGMLRGIVAFEMPIDRLEGKAKLSQNRDATDQARVAAALEQSADPTARATAKAMRAPPT
ncbi:MAG TPA: FMN-binding negative transcriptional regulator [Candidatus Sulfotelmatobacter sp.]|nr:FMN-binding negative transcriptional regulator [Candidatus Sulfotelmatobacter sp.]